MPALTLLKRSKEIEEECLIVVISPVAHGRAMFENAQQSQKHICRMLRVEGKESL